MREFILRASKGVTNPNFINLNDLPGAGRLDLVCRCVTNALFVSNDMRRDTIIHVVLEGPDNPPRTVSFDGRELRNLAPDERNCASHIRIALERSAGFKLGECAKSEPGITVCKSSLEGMLKEKSKTTQLIYLHPEGTDIRKFEFKEDVCFIFGDHVGIERATEKLLKRLGAVKVSLAPAYYLASQCVTICHNELDVRRLMAGEIELGS